ncbi:UpxY family transcription antiterminator [Formosa sp. S-31]|uniref:UpxY family transcription antiterminator n=1 Tax=Formosa sp. S-31 TaxID=2790949 RepID=UPI003EBC5E05
MERKWHVVYTKSRNEKKVAEKLERLGVKAYCPVLTEVRQWSDRKKKVLVPMLPSMVLVHVSETERHLVFDVPGVVRYMFWNGVPVVVRNEEVDALREVETGKGFDSAKVESLKPGTEINLSELGFEAAQGTVKYVSGNQCWVVLKDLGYVVKLQLQ